MIHHSSSITNHIILYYDISTNIIIFIIIHTEWYDHIIFNNILLSIKNQNKNDFIENLILLATAFSKGKDLFQSKIGFIEAFTYLYVTYNFPSEGIAHNYFHFILNCGHIR